MASLSPPAAAAANPNPRKRKSKGKGKGRAKPSKKPKPDSPRVRKPSKKLLQKRARQYNSDDDDRSDDAFSASSGDESSGPDAHGDRGGGVTRFEEGCRAFRVAFLKIMTKKLPDDPLGPILSAHKKMVAAKLAEEVEEHKSKGEARKEKHVAAERGHVKPLNYLDEKEKLLIKVATKGVVRLFNAVSKAQNPQKRLDPSKTRDAKVLAKERKQTFLTELKKSSNQGQKDQATSNSSKHIDKDEDEPGWAPLRDTYMLSSKLKDWDKMQDCSAADERTEVPLDNSSDDE